MGAIVLLITVSTNAQNAPTTSRDVHPESKPAEAPSAPPSSQPVDEADGIPSGLTVAAVQEQIKTAEALQNLGEKDKARLLDRLRRALEAAKAAETSRARTSEFTKARQEAPDVLQSLKAAVAQAASQPASQPTLEPAADGDAKSLGELERQLADAETELADKKQALSKLETEATLRADRKRAIAGQIAEASKLMEKANSTLAAEPKDEPVELAAARRLMCEARRVAAQSAIESYEEELRSYDARTETLIARTDLAKLELAAAERKVAHWKQIVNEARSREAQRQAEQARIDLEMALPAVRDLAETNSKLAQERATLVEESQTLTREADETEEWSKTLETRSRTIRDIIKSEGIQGVGPRLWQERGNLPDRYSLQRRISSRMRKGAEAQLRLLDLEEKRSKLVKFHPDQLLKDLPPDTSPAQKDALPDQVNKLRQKQSDLLISLRTELDQYHSKLVELNGKDESLLAKVRELASFIDENVLWIPSTGPLHKMGLPLGISDRAKDAFESLASIGRDFRNYPAIYIIAFLLFAGIYSQRPKMRRRSDLLGEKINKIYTDSFEATLEVLAYCIIASLVWPGVMWFFAHRLASNVEPSALSESVAAGLKRAAIPFLLMGILRRMCREKGLAEAHFRWRSESVRLVRMHLYWLMPVAIPLIFIAAATEHAAPFFGESWRDSIGRVAFMIASIAVAVFIQRLVRPTGGVLEGTLNKNPDGWLSRLRFIWYPLAVGFPIACAVAAYVGYLYTAVQLERRLILSIWLIMGGTVVHALCIRWLLLAQRRVAIEQLKKKRAAAEAAQGDAGKPGSEAPPIIEEPQIDLAKINANTRRLLRFVVGGAVILSFWLIWADTTPAFAILDNVHLWSHSVEGAPDPSDDPGIADSSIDWITLADVTVAILIAIVALMLAKNLPSLLEISILQRLPLDAAARYAITSVAQYGLTIVGIIIAFGRIGIGWSQIQWLAAAITVGLGFGLQEIFANFVSGLIILVEQPIRVGDVVTIDGTSGVVSKIRIRATTIINADRQEFIVPNKQFVTGNVINWTLSDNITRLVFPIGVAYGSDTRRVKQTLLEVARTHEQVLKEPEPSAVFTGFGDSALNFELRLFVRELGDRVPVQHELNTLIDDAFRREGIEIPFPQRDMHIRTTVAQAPLEESTPQTDGKPARQ